MAIEAISAIKSSLYPTFDKSQSHVTNVNVGQSSSLTKGSKDISSSYTRVDGGGIISEHNRRLSLAKNDREKEKSGSIKDKEYFSIREKMELEKLKQRDREVRTHEMAHVLAGGSYVLGGPHYIFVVGPDGKLYAVGGEVKIDLSPVPNDPDATIRKAEAIKRAALAPARPSAQDRAIAAKAEQMAMKARIEKLKKQQERIKGNLLTKDDPTKFYNTLSIPHMSINGLPPSGSISYIERLNQKVSTLLANKSYRQNFSKDFYTDPVFKGVFV